jgi:DNA (cytosine-5)-methyltransferase 1
MRCVSLFAGVGGFDLGFEHAGMTCVGQVEIDPACRAVLDHHWPHVPKHDDVTTAKEWADNNGITGTVDLVCGGFPCQPFSVAGKRLGRDDLRGNLFWNALDFTLHVGADTLIVENVPGLLSSDKGSTFGEIITDLAEAGFHHIEWRVVDSQHFGVPQRRSRIFIVASVGGFNGRPILVEPESLRWHPPQGRAPRTDTARTVEGGTLGGGWAGSASQPGIAAPLGALTGGPRTSDIENATYVVGSLSLSNSSAMQQIASTVTTGTGVRYDPDTESLVVLSQNGAAR